MSKLKNYKYILIIILVSVIASIPLFWNNLDIYFDDGIQHISRAYATLLAFQNGENTNVLSVLTNGFGYSWNLFYGPLSANLIVFCKLFTSTFINAYKFTLFLGLLFSRTYYVYICKFFCKK